MMKNRGLIIGLIVSIIVLILFLIALLCFGITGNLNFGYFSSISQNVIYEHNYDSEVIENIIVNNSYGDIIVKKSDGNKINIIVYGNDDNKINVNNENNILKIEALNTKKWFFGNSGQIKIEIMVPKNFANNIELENDLGDIDIENLENASLKITEDCGNVTVGICKNIIVTNSLGDIEIKGILNKCSIKNDCGDLKIDELNINENSDIKLDLGDVKIRKINDIYIDAETDLGKVKLDSNNRSSEITLKIENDCGDIKVGK